ncbi:MAG: cobalamin biosynthesis protein CobD [Sphingobium sp.]|nr:MAG: cobalamin biosynthesis protein CobD [Sphingobium sp.]
MIIDRPEQLLAALLLEAACGYPAWLLRRVGHPVTWAGRAIVMMDRQWNRPGIDVAAGLIASIVLLAIGSAAGWLIERLAGGWVGMLGVILITTTGLAQRSLWQHISALAVPLAQGDMELSRRALSAVVGRDTTALDEASMAAAGIETLAESFCDGVVAPAFWFALLGLPGLFAFKCISTADSMIGHRDLRYERFGKASARVDDAMNWMPARLSGMLICLAGGRGWRIMARDASLHLSPNAGWPESAIAGVLGVRIGGGAFYDGEWIARPELGDGPRAGVPELHRAMRVYLRACLLLWLCVGGVAWLR